MLDMLKVGFAIVFVFICLITRAQERTLFRAYDCREHAGESVADKKIMEAMASIDLDSSLVSAIPHEVPLITAEIDTVDGWKDWSAVENYSFGKDRGALTMINDLRALHPFFRDRVIQLIENCKEKGIDLAIVETYRTQTKQVEYKTMGKKYTSSGAGRSKHQYGLAIDVVPVLDSVAVWDNAMLWRKIGVAGEKVGLRWGGRWRKPFDPGHFEWTGGLTSSNLKAGLLPNVPKGEERYPCLDEDLKLLRKYWSEWETSQSSLTRK